MSSQSGNSAKTKQIKVKIKEGDDVTFAKALDVIDSMLNGPWKESVEAWEAKRDGMKTAEQATLFSRLLKIAERLR